MSEELTELTPETLEEVIENKTEIKIEDGTKDGRRVIIDPKRLQFNENNLHNYMEQEASWYDYFGNLLADAEREYQFVELKYDELYSKKFVDFKEQGGSDKMVEAKVKSDEEVVKLKKRSMDSKRKVKLLQQHLRAWDKNHENAQSRGHSLRKEMDKLNATSAYYDDNLDDQLVDTISKMKEEE